MVVTHLLVCSALLVLGAIVLAALQGRAQPWERRYIWWSFLAHAFSAVVMVLLTQYVFGGGDIFAYQNLGAALAEHLRHDWATYAPEALAYLLGRPIALPLRFAQTSTGSMIALSAWLHLPLGGSIYAKCMLLGLLGVPSKYLIYKGLAKFFHARYHRYLLFSCMLLPSMVFWTSGLLKEAVALIGLGPMAYGTAQIITQGRWRALLVVILGGWVTSIFKAYVLFPWLMASGVCWYWHRTLKSKGKIAIITQPIYLVVFGALAVGGIITLGALFPKYSLGSITQEIAVLQSVGQRTEGGSNYAIGDAPALTPTQQLALLPSGLLFALLRPFFFEVRNVSLLLNALETTAFLVLWYRAVRRHGLRGLAGLVLKTPGLIWMVIFVLMFGSIVGIATTNVGTLSRYRIPMMPFYVSFLMITGWAPTSSSPRPAASRRPRRRLIEAQPR